MVENGVNKGKFSLYMEKKNIIEWGKNIVFWAI